MEWAEPEIVCLLSMTVKLGPHARLGKSLIAAECLRKLPSQQQDCQQVLRRMLQARSTGVRQAHKWRWLANIPVKDMVVPASG